MDEFQRLRPQTILRVDILTPGETIAWTGLMRTWDGIETEVAVEVSDPLDNPIGTFPSGAVIPADAGTGTYYLRPIGLDLWGDPINPDDPIESGPPDGANDPLAEWAVVVDGATAERGRLWSSYWRFDTGRWTEGTAYAGSFYGVLDGGAPGNNAVIEMRTSGLAGNQYDITANRAGATSGAITANGRSTPIGGWDIPPEFPVYLNPPEDATYSFLDPLIDGALFAYADGCDAVASGIIGGTLSFESNVNGTWHLICDGNGDGIYDLSSDEDVHVVGEATIGLNEIPFDGTGNDGESVPPGEYNCRVKLTVGEYHFVASDMETSYEGLRMFRVDADLSRVGLPMFWNDTEIQSGAVLMPNDEFGQMTSGATGMDSGDYDDAAVANLNSRAWGEFSRFGKGDQTFLDTFSWVNDTDSAVIEVTVGDNLADADSDRLIDLEETCLVGTDPGLFDTDVDGLGDGDEVIDLGTDPLDPDTDDDSLLDGLECPDPAAPQNSDTDRLIDALDDDDDNDTVLTIDEDNDRSGSLLDDDTDGDGLLDYRDADDDGDGVPTRNEDSNFDGSALDDDWDGDGIPDRIDADDDGDGVLTVLEDYTPTDGAGLPLGDGTPGGSDWDMDGRQDYRDDDDDNDGIPTLLEDSNGDGNHFNDDADGDGLPNFLDDDDDNDGVPSRGEDSDFDGDPSNDDLDGDGIPDYLDTDDDGDGVPTRDEDHDGDGDPRNDDTDGDGRADFRDIDDDNDGTPTRDEDVDGSGFPGDDDFDGDGLLDFLDTDDDDDGVDSFYEGGPDQDTDGDGMADRWDTDDDNDGIDTRDEDLDGDGLIRDHDRDGDGILNYLDPDDDGDGIPTIEEGRTDTDGDGFEDYVDFDSDDDGVSDAIEGNVDTDNDGLADYVDVDDDDDGLLTIDELGGDTDNDGITDRLDDDDDGDGIPTKTEIEDGAEFGDDVDGDDMPNWYDRDSDDDRLRDQREGSGDSDGDGIPDYLDPAVAETWYEGGCRGCSGTGGTPMAPWLVLLTLGLVARRRR
jgi:uncharacterized protein (TIGR03382 family)